MRITILIIVALSLALVTGCNTATSSKASINFVDYKQAAAKNSCTGSFDCQYWGECSFIKGMCMATTKMQCQQSEICRTHGRCSLERGACVPQPAKTRVTKLKPASKGSTEG